MGEGNLVRCLSVYLTRIHALKVVKSDKFWDMIPSGLVIVSYVKRCENTQWLTMHYL